MNSRKDQPEQEPQIKSSEASGEQGEGAGSDSTLAEDHFSWLRKLIGHYWRPLLVLIGPIVCAAWTSLQWLFDVKGPSATAIVLILLLAVGAFFLVRCSSISITVTRWIVGPPKPLRNVGLIFRGPRPYTDTHEDQERFYGRRKEIEECWQIIQNSSFVVVDGETGCGKSSLLSAGVLAKAKEKYHIIECRVGTAPMENLSEVLRKRVPSVGKRGLPNAIKEVVANFQDKPVLLCMDQFEDLCEVKDRVAALNPTYSSGRT